MKLYTQLNFGGNCEQAFRFYEEHLGGKITVLMRHRDAPSSNPAPAGWEENAILHAHMSIADTHLVGNDVPPQIFKPIRSSYLVLSVDTSQEAERIHGVLADGGEIYMPLNETFFAFPFSMLRDKFGTLWTIIHPRSAE